MKSFPIVIEINIDYMNDLHNLFRVDSQTHQVMLDAWTKRMNALLESWSPEDLRQATDPDTAH